MKHHLQLHRNYLIIAGIILFSHIPVHSYAKIVIIWNHGSNSSADDEPDYTAPWCRALFEAPDIIKKLEDERISWQRIEVVNYCKANVAGGYTRRSGWKRPKVCARANRLVSELSPGGKFENVPPNRLFLAGQSEGAWLSLLIKRYWPKRIAGVLAFAPAFANKRAERHGYELPNLFPKERRRRLNWMRHQHRKWLGAKTGQSADLNSMVFAFHCDPFEWPQDLDFLQGREKLGQGNIKFKLFPGSSPLQCGARLGAANYAGQSFVFCKHKKNTPGSITRTFCTNKKLYNCPSKYAALCPSGSHPSPHKKFMRHDLFRNEYQLPVKQFIEERASAASSKIPPPPGQSVCDFLEGASYPTP